MKSEDLFNGITQVRDDLVEQAAPKRGSGHKKIWTGVLAAALALAVGVGALWPRDGEWKQMVMTFRPASISGQDDQSGTTDTSGERVESPHTGSETTFVGQLGQGERPMDHLGESTRSYAVSLAAYPERAVYPDYASFTSPDGKKRDYEGYSQAQDLYYADCEKRQAYMADYNGELNGFFSAVMEQFLSNGAGGNRVISPVNLYLALAMLAEVTDGDSRQQVLDLIGAESIEQLREQAGKVWQGVYQDEGASTVILGSSLWLNQNIEFVPETLDTLARDYFASSFQGEMGSAEFNQALQDWTNTMTGGLLREQVGQLEMRPETILALASTIYFKAGWYKKFSEEDTAKGIFHSLNGDVERDFMHMTEIKYYYWGDDFSAICRSYGGGCNMWFILPDEGVQAEELLGDPQIFQLIQNRGDWVDQKKVKVHQSIPKFDVESNQDLIRGLEELGVTDVFDDRVSDFTPLTTQVDDIYLGQVQHAARVKIDEEGGEAAAYTMGMAYTASIIVLNDEVDFILDRPFLFVITSDAASLPLFAGVVNQP